MLLLFSQPGKRNVCKQALLNDNNNNNSSSIVINNNNNNHTIIRTTKLDSKGVICYGILKYLGPVQNYF